MTDWTYSYTHLNKYIYTIKWIPIEIDLENASHSPTQFLIIKKLGCFYKIFDTFVNNIIWSDSMTGQFFCNSL